MTSIGGLFGAVFMALLSFLIVVPLTSNLSGTHHLVTLVVSVAVAVLVGGLTGSTILRRARARLRNLATFSGVAAGVGGGLVGAVWMVALLAGYLTTYGAWPDGLVDTVLTVLAFPILGAFGFTIGGLVFGAIGLIGGSVLGKLLPARRF
jgi:hypothetical protein